MGNFISKLLPNWLKEMRARILLVGLDNAGKTTLLYRFQLQEDTLTIPTIGFNVETVKYNNILFNVWDVGGQTKIRRLWHHYFRGSNAIVFVVDSNDRPRMDEVGEELSRLLSHETLAGIPILIFSNKQDLPNAMNSTDLINKLQLYRVKDREWFVQPCVCTEGQGIYEGFDWLGEVLKRQK